MLTNRLGVPFPVALICAGLVAGLIGMVFGMPSIRVKGFYLAITTIAAQFIIIWVINHWGYTGGFNGIAVPYASLGGLVFRSKIEPVLPDNRHRRYLPVFRQESGAHQGGAGFHRHPG